MNGIFGSGWLYNRGGALNAYAEGFTLLAEGFHCLGVPAIRFLLFAGSIMALF